MRLFGVTVVAFAKAQLLSPSPAPCTPLSLSIFTFEEEETEEEGGGAVPADSFAPLHLPRSHYVCQLQKEDN